MVYMIGMILAFLLILALRALALNLYAKARADAKAAAALSYADEFPPFARALGTVLKLDAALPGSTPWLRPEHGNRSVYVLRGR